MAPEQALGARDKIGPPTDVYALGAALYEVLTGVPPFQGATRLDTLRQVQCDPPRPPRSLRAMLPPELETICMKCLEKEPRERYASATALAEDLRRYLGGKPIAARRAGLWTRAYRWARQRPTVAGVIGAAIAAVLALQIVTFWRAEQLRQDNAAILADSLLQQQRNVEARDYRGAKTIMLTPSRPRGRPLHAERT
jgi:hypothetical protein